MARPRDIDLEAVARKRDRAMEMVKAGSSRKAIAAALGVATITIKRWQRQTGTVKGTAKRERVIAPAPYVRGYRGGASL